MKKTKLNSIVDGNKDNGVDNSGDDSNDGGDKYLTYLSQGGGCCLMTKSKQNMHAVGKNKQ
eukprot:12727625-Ditylum_brightwellii.AAC.1